jgi:5-methylcytosine-specific restriction endonuclease McrA
MNKSEYSEKLKDPRWQKKRLEIFERDGWCCLSCGRTNAPLSIHHLYYDFDLNPWDYLDTSLITLCMECHEAEQLSYNNVMRMFKEATGEAGMTSDDIFKIVLTVRNRASWQAPK